MKTIERRQTARPTARVEVRAKGDKEIISGYAAVFYNAADPGTEYWLWDDFVERLMPGCFDRAISEGHDARCLYDHDTQTLLGRVSSGTCKLSIDKVGLRFEVEIDPTDPDHQRVAAKIRRGDLTGCSFAFNNASADWSEITIDGKSVSIRNITDLDLHDVGPVTHPAYEATEVGLRTAVASSAELVEARSTLTAHRQSLNDYHSSDAIEVDHVWANINP